MLNINKVKAVYLARGVTDLRKSIDGLSLIVQESFNLKKSPIKDANKNEIRMSY